MSITSNPLHLIIGEHHHFHLLLLLITFSDSVSTTTSFSRIKPRGGKGQLEALEEAHEEVEAQIKDRNPNSRTSPNPTSIPTPGARGSAVVDPAPASPIFPPRGLVLETEVVVETKLEEDLEEEQEEEVGVVELSDDEMKGVAGDAHLVVRLSEEESDDDFMMWEEEPLTLELVELFDESLEEEEMDEEEEEVMMDSDYAQFLAYMGVWIVPAEKVEPEIAAADPQVGTSEEESDGSSSTDGGDSGDDPYFEPSYYRE